MQTVIVNSGCANIASVKFAFERLGANVNVSSDLQEISKADRVILPGVGTFDFAMSGLIKNQLINQKEMLYTLKLLKGYSNQEMHIGVTVHQKP